MMDLIQGDIVPINGTHHFCQVLIQLEEDIHAKAIVGSIEETAVLFFCERFNFRFTRKPSRGPAYDGNSPFNAPFDVVKSRIRMRKLYGGVSHHSIEVSLIVDINFASNL